MNIQPRSIMSLACLCALAFNFAPAVFAQSAEKSSPAATKLATDPCLLEQQVILQSLATAEKGDAEVAYTLLLGENSFSAGNASAEVLGSRIAAVAGFLKNLGKADQGERFIRHALKQNELKVHRNMTAVDREAIVYWRTYVLAEVKGEIREAELSLLESDSEEDTPRLKEIRGRVAKQSERH